MTFDALQEINDYLAECAFKNLAKTKHLDGFFVCDQRPVTEEDIRIMEKAHGT